MLFPYEFNDKQFFCLMPTVMLTGDSFIPA